MRLHYIVLHFLAAPALCSADPQLSTEGIKKLADRLFAGHGDQFEFAVTGTQVRPSRWSQPKKDNYTVSTSSNGKIHVQGTSLNALARGLRHYAQNALYLDDFMFADSHVKVPDILPKVDTPFTGLSVVPWRYNLNTVSFSYSYAWNTWEDWERQLDWAALRGVNIQLAWLGYEKILLDTLTEMGMKEADVISFFSGPAFQAWNRFGNVGGSWGGVGDVPKEWIEAQFTLQKKIVGRMVELGITPVLPAFTGYVPYGLRTAHPGSNFTIAPKWIDMPDQYTHAMFLNPQDPLFGQIQRAFIQKQIQAYGNVTNVYTLDQFNEMSPASTSTFYLENISKTTYGYVTDANPAAIWLMQGWLFYNNPGFWTQERINAYLGGVKDKTSMIILDLYAEAAPVWKRTQSFAGRPWIWCQLLDFGGNMALYGQMSKITQDTMHALQASDSLVGFGLAPEGYEGNDVMFDLIFDQAWSATPIETQSYIKFWTARRYAGISTLPQSLFQAWELLRSNIYNNVNPQIPSVGVALYQIAPALNGLVNRTGHYPPPTALHYDPKVLKQAWRLMINAASAKNELWDIPAFQLDLTDVTRQAMSNFFIIFYNNLVTAYNSCSVKSIVCNLSAAGEQLLDLLTGIDTVLSQNRHFTLERWLKGSQNWATQTKNAKLMSFNARSQITVWNWNAGSLNDYAAKSWSGLIRSYYRPRWSIFIDGLKDAIQKGSLDQGALNNRIRQFEKTWQYGGFVVNETSPSIGSLRTAVLDAQKKWPNAFQ
ncbi:hypothetical protein QQS21_002286 [Conoideocrella luteorostrata]|uniref:Alpha-N-acetylglucosaminidase n=1 Tax=Conoideocrella luteorostrata TaxID=1105319 RepID=A0AAJ0CY24_9HYPO|nr:hypothetical protein QQS21_002286 [Conoideocrella luteorostrata]